MLVRKNGFAAEKNGMFYFLEVGFGEVWQQVPNRLTDSQSATVFGYRMKAFRIASSLGSKKERSFFPRAATADRAALGMQRITLTPRLGQTNAVSVSVRKVPEPSLSCLSRYFCALTRRTSCDVFSKEQLFQEISSAEQPAPLMFRLVLSCAASGAPRFRCKDFSAANRPCSVERIVEI